MNGENNEAISDALFLRGIFSFQPNIRQPQINKMAEN
jgi:hypothetical protein